MAVAELIGLALAAVSAGTQAYSSYAQGKAASKQSAYNALIAQHNASLAEGKGEITKTITGMQADAFKKRIAAVKGEQRANYAKAGVTMEGSPLVTAADTQLQADIDELAIRYAGDVEFSVALAKASEDRQTAALYAMQGTAARSAGRLGAGASLISGVSSGYDKATAK